MVRINDENEEGLVLLVEDKFDTHEHSEQIARYLESAKMQRLDRARQFVSKVAHSYSD